MAYPRGSTPVLPPCDSFFVETYDNNNNCTVSRPYPNEQVAKLMARERQYAIADQMSNAVREEYQDDILAHMHMMDVGDLHLNIGSREVFANIILCSRQPYLTSIRLTSSLKSSGS